MTNGSDSLTDKTPMNSQNDEEVLRKEYLLGQLSDDLREQVEERLIDDEEFAGELSVTEDNLIDDYVFGVLSQSERKSFEENFVISDDRRRKMRLAQSIDIYLDKLDGPLSVAESPVETSSRWTPLQLVRSYKFWVAVPAVVILVVIAPRIARLLKPADPGVIVQAARTRIEQQLAQLNQQSNGPALPARDLVLDPTPVLRDTGGLKRITLSPDVKLLTLKFVLPSAPDGNYRALVSTVEGTELFAVEGLKPESEAGRAVMQLKIPTEFLATGDYQVQLSGPDGQVRYYFGIIK